MIITGILDLQSVLNPQLRHWRAAATAWVGRFLQNAARVRGAHFQAVRFRGIRARSRVNFDQSFARHVATASTRRARGLDSVG